MRAEALANTDKSKLICISVFPSQKNSIAWTEENEIRFKGNMYDVVRTESQRDGSINYFCLNDSKEEELFGKLGDHLTSQMDAGKSLPSSAGKILIKLFAFDYFSSFEKNIFYIQSNEATWPSINTSAPFSFPAEISTPPPQIA